MRLAFALAFMPALPVAAMVQPCYLDAEVAEAVTVIQISDHVVERSNDGSGCRLTGTVVRSFRGDIAPGTRVQTSFYCGEPTVGGLNLNEEAIARASVVEIHAAAEGGIAGDGWGLELLDAPTDEPAFRIEFPEGC